MCVFEKNHVVAFADLENKQENIISELEKLKEKKCDVFPPVGG